MFCPFPIKIIISTKIIRLYQIKNKGLRTKEETNLEIVLEKYPGEHLARGLVTAGRMDESKLRGQKFCPPFLIN